ncbi:MAG: hypothetical protein ACM3ZA_02170 [Bacillota bacterium]
MNAAEDRARQPPEQLQSTVPMMPLVGMVIGPHVPRAGLFTYLSARA